MIHAFSPAPPWRSRVWLSWRPPCRLFARRESIRRPLFGQPGGGRHETVVLAQDPGGWSYVLRVFARRPEDDVDAELRFHFDERIAELTAQGRVSR